MGSMFMGYVKLVTHYIVYKGAVAIVDARSCLT
jgi:hypothetical protein